MKWKTRVVQIRKVPAKTSISYERTFITKRRTTVGVLPVGYGHGVPFQLSNRGEAIVAGQRVPIIGRVTMDMTMVDLTKLPARPEVGDEVTLVGCDGEAKLTAADVARWAGTITYDILCGINKRVPRVYLRNGKVETVKSLLGTQLNSIESL